MKDDVRQFQAARYALLSEVVLLIAKTPDIHQLEQKLINSLKWVLDFERCTIALLNTDRSSYQLRTLLETRPGIAGVDEPVLPLAKGIPGEVIRTQQMRLVSEAGDMPQDPADLGDPGMEDGSLASILCLPLQAYGKVLGALTFGASTPNIYQREDIQVAILVATHLALLGNFVLVPLLAIGLTRVIPMEQSLQIGLLVLATAGGAPFLPKLAQGAKGNIAWSVGLMSLLMTVTVFYIPIVLPLMLPGVEINPWDIASSLITTMLIPLTIGLLIKSHSPGTAQSWAAMLNKISTVALLVMMVVGLGLNISNIIALIGSGGILTLLLFIVGSLVIGLALGGRDPGIRNVMGLGTAQRNIAAAVLVSAQNFTEGNTLSLVLVAAILLLLILLPTAKRFGARGQAAEPQPLKAE